MVNAAPIGVTESNGLKLGELAIETEIAEEALMGIDDKADNKAEELKGKSKAKIATLQTTRIWRPRAEPSRQRAA